MPLIPVDTTTAQESKPVANGRYDLTIADVDPNARTKAGKPQIRVSIGIDGHDKAPNVTHFLSLPNSDDDAGKAEFKKLMIERFLVAFKIPHSKGGFNTDDFVGARANCELTLSEPDDGGNVYNRLQLPRLKGDTPSAAPKPPSKKG